MKISSNFVSALSSSNSKVPLFIKNAFNTAGYTAFSYDAGGNIEAKDRLIDEVGTAAIWLYGIPVYQKLLDKTLYKAAKTPSNVDVRVINNKSYLSAALDNASGAVKEQLKTAASNPLKTKGLAIAKFAAALGLTIASYSWFTKARQNITKSNIEKEFNKKMRAETFSDNNSANPGKKQGAVLDIQSFGSRKNAVKNNPSFGSGAWNLIANPMNSMKIMDVDISGERVVKSRNKNEFWENVIKEGSILFFNYEADKYINKGLEYASKKYLKAPIDLDAKFLASNSAKELLENQALQAQVKTFNQRFAKDAGSSEFYNFIFKNENNAVVNAAKKSGIIQTVKDEAGNIKIDPGKYIDPDEMKKLGNSLQEFISAGKSYTQGASKFLNTARNLKVLSAFVSIGICCLSLGYIVPKIIYDFRKNRQNGSSDFHVKTQYEKELAEKMKFGRKNA